MGEGVENKCIYRLYLFDFWLITNEDPFWKGTKEVKAIRGCKSCFYVKKKGIEI